MSLVLRQQVPRYIPRPWWWYSPLRRLPTFTPNLSRTINETLNLQDGGAQDFNDPDGAMTETVSDGTVWTKKFPPFHTRTRWS